MRRNKMFLAFLLLLLLGIWLVTYADMLTSKIMPTTSTPKSFDMQDQLIDSIRNTLPSVVHISNDSMHWQGSGVVITRDIILTARHVVENGTEFTITLNDGRQFKSTQAISSKKYDYGFVKIDSPLLTPVKLGSIKACELGQMVYAIGSPYGKLNFNSATLGIISGLERDCDVLGKNYGWSVTFTTDTAGHPGNSGCPVLTLDGVVRGILVGGHSPVLIYCIPVDLLLKDGATIQMMFNQNAYYFEEKFISPDYQYAGDANDVNDVTEDPNNAVP